MELNIYAYKCKKCGCVHYPYKTICKNCGKNAHNEFDLVPIAKKGKLLTFTDLYTLPSVYEKIKLTFGIVELEDGIRIIGQLNIKKPKMGMKVKGKVEVVREDTYDKKFGMVFSEE